MSKAIRSALAGALAAGLGATLAATAAGGTAAAQQRGGVLNSVIHADIRGTNPGVDRDGTTDIVHHHLVEGLVGYRDDFDVGPMLAESFEISEDNSVFTFRLRRGVKFHNGAEMTAAEVLWSWNRLMDPATGWRCRDVFSGERDIEVISVEAPDDHTVVYSLAGPSSTFLHEMARFDCGAAAVIHPESVKADGSWDRPVGTGPFKLGEWRHGQHLDVERFDDYSPRDDEKTGYVGRKEVFVDRVRWHILPEPAVVRSALLAGEVDVMTIPPRFVEEMEAHPRVSVSSIDTASWDVLLIQSQDPLLSDVRMRRAIALAIDTETVARATTNGRIAANPSPIPPASAYHGEVQKQGQGFDPDAARALLQEAGYNGERLVMQTNRRYQSMYDRALIMHQMLRAVGLNVEIEVMEWGTQLDNYQTGNYQLQSFGYSPRLDPFASFEGFTGPQSRKAWKDEAAIELLSQAARTNDRARRQEIFDELHRRFIEEVPALSLYHSPDFYAVRDRVQDFTIWGGGRPRFWGVWLSE